jgi:hypothetical protein
MTTETTTEKADRLLVGCMRIGLYLAGWAAILTGAGLFAWQLYALAKTGTWHPYSVADGLFWLSGAYWLIQPTDWHGIHAVLAWLSGPLVALLLGMGASTSAQHFE